MHKITHDGQQIVVFGPVNKLSLNDFDLNYQRGKPVFYYNPFDRWKLYYIHEITLPEHNMISEYKFQESDVLKGLSTITINRSTLKSDFSKKWLVLSHGSIMDQNGDLIGSILPSEVDDAWINDTHFTLQDAIIGALALCQRDDPKNNLF